MIVVFTTLVAVFLTAIAVFTTASSEGRVLIKTRHAKLPKENVSLQLNFQVWEPKKVI